MARVPQATVGHPVVIPQISEAGLPFFSAAAVNQWREAGELDNTVWLICPHVKAQEILAAELDVWGVECRFLPEYEWAGFEETLPDPESAAERLAALKEIHHIQAEGGGQVVVMTKGSLDEPAPVPGLLNRRTIPIRVGKTLDSELFISQLEEAGYEKEPQVYQRGQYALRGGIIDVFSWQAVNPVRIEFFDDEVDSLREFDIDQQTSINKLDATEVLLSESDLEMSGVVRDYFQDADLVIDVAADCEEASVRFYLGEVAEIEGRVDDDGACLENPLGTFEAGDFIMQEQRREDFMSQIREWERDRWTVIMAFHSDGEKDRFAELIYQKAWDDGFLKPVRGALSRGFSIPDAKIAVLSDAEIFGRYQNQWQRRNSRLSQQRQRSQQVSSLREFGYGDTVVHIDYGIGKFRGIKTKESAGKEEEVLEIEYDEEARLYVPLDQAHLVSRYIGSGKKAPKLSKLGDKRWARTRKNAENSIMDYAANLLSIQAQRETHQGFAHPPDNKWQWEFENAFIFKETPDQLRAIQEAKEDMESSKPMDRLVCGDVGFGKTEVAIRAAFKAVMSGKQVALIAPTTVLADQHFQGFRQRMSDFPIQINALTRYCSAAEQKQTLEDLKMGKCDMVIGTHRVISKDVKFKNLGLVVIDE
ncbi:MAG: DEAD/DEAH box helicase, partial [Verrucomicrobiota bacterium]